MFQNRRGRIRELPVAVREFDHPPIYQQRALAKTPAAVSTPSKVTAEKLRILYRALRHRQLLLFIIYVLFIYVLFIIV